MSSAQVIDIALCCMYMLYVVCCTKTQCFNINSSVFSKAQAEYENIWAEHEDVWAEKRVTPDKMMIFYF